MLSTREFWLSESRNRNKLDNGTWRGACRPRSAWTYLILRTPSKSPPVCINVPSAMNWPDEHQGSVCRKRGRTVLLPGSYRTECAVQSCGSTKSLLSLQTPAAGQHWLHQVHNYDQAIESRHHSSGWKDIWILPSGLSRESLTNHTTLTASDYFCGLESEELALDCRTIFKKPFDLTAAIELFAIYKVPSSMELRKWSK